MAKIEFEDPVAEKTEEEQAKSDDELKKVFDISNMKIADFKSAQLKDARTRHPFDGYPEKKIQIGAYPENPNNPKSKKLPLIVNLTHLMVFNEEVKQDPSGERVSLGFPEMRNKEGKVIRPNTQREGMIKTAHNRRAKDYESGGVDFDAVFDRTINLADGPLNQVCIIPSPSVRAQIVFKYNAQTERIEHDARYRLADPDQIPRLRRVFEWITNPRIRREEAIRRTFDEGGDMTTQSTMPGIPEGE